MPLPRWSAISTADEESVRSSRISTRGKPPDTEFSLHVLQRSVDGQWPIVFEMYVDARMDETYGTGNAVGPSSSGNKQRRE